MLRTKPLSAMPPFVVPLFTHLQGAVLAGSLLLLPTAPAWADAQTSQTFQLHPGWNAIFLEVQPQPDDPATVFRDLPLESAWTWLERGSSVQFIQNPSEPTWGQPSWAAYYQPVSRSFLTNLHAVFANRAYLLKLGGNQAVDWTVSGRPSVRGVQWVPDSFNLVGFRVDPSSPPSFGAFFSPSRAHVGQAVFRLSSAGTWEPVEAAAVTAMRSGEAFWAYCEGGSTYQGPVSVDFPIADGLDFGALLDEQTVTFRNLSAEARRVSVSLPASVDWLAYRQFDASLSTYVWPDLRDLEPLPVAAGRTATLHVGVRRERLAVGAAGTVLEVRDDAGMRLLVAVDAEKPGP